MSQAELDDPVLQRLIDRVRAARAARLHINIVGGGSKAFYGETSRGADLSMREMRGISSYEPSELVITARAGTPLAEVEAALAEHGQCLPFEPPRFELPGSPGSTVGGMVAAGLAGPARAWVGGVRDYVLGASLLTGRAELLSFGGQVIKNVAGYDVSRLLVGSLGQLGIICEVSLKVLPQAVASATLRFELSEAEALAQLNAWGSLPLPINASAWWSGTLVLRLAGAAAAVRAALAKLGGEVVSPEQAAAFWTGLRDQHDEFFLDANKAVAAGATLWRLSVPQTAPPMGLRGEQLVEWGGAQRWLVSASPAQAVREAASQAGGHATVFRCDPQTSAALGPRFAALSPPLMRIHRELKTAFDPDRLFNPGRLYADL